MKTVERFLNKSEEVVFKELSTVAADNSLKAFAKPRLSDVLDKQNTYLEPREFSYYTRAHFDFLITDTQLRPFMAVEYDGPRHSEAEQAELDRIKNRLCEFAALPLLRINADYVLKKFRGMTLLRWIIEVCQLQMWFEDARSMGQVPLDEPFDPAMIMSDGSGRKWPYWLSVEANLHMNQFLRGKSGRKAWVSLIGSDAEDNLHYFEYLRVDDDFLFVKTAARNLGAAIPVFDMLGEVSHCELAEKLRLYLEGSQSLLPLREFKPIHDRICRKYKMHPGGWMGSALELIE